MVNIEITINMEGIQKLKCTSCGTSFMSETDQSKCPTCLEESQNKATSNESGSHFGCGCGHSH